MNSRKPVTNCYEGLQRILCTLKKTLGKDLLDVRSVTAELIVGNRVADSLHVQSNSIIT